MRTRPAVAGIFSGFLEQLYVYVSACALLRMCLRLDHTMKWNNPANVVHDLLHQLCAGPGSFRTGWHFSGIQVRWFGNTHNFHNQHKGHTVDEWMNEKMISASSKWEEHATLAENPTPPKATRKRNIPYSTWETTTKGHDSPTTNSEMYLTKNLHCAQPAVNHWKVFQGRTTHEVQARPMEAVMVMTQDDPGDPVLVGRKTVKLFFRDFIFYQGLRLVSFFN